MPGARNMKRKPAKEAFLAAYAEVGNIRRAAIIAKCSRDLHYRWLREDPDYPARFEAAHESACDALEDEARRRAVEGTLKPVYQGGVKVGTIREYSDTLLIFLLKGAKPEKFRERQSVEVSGQVSGVIAVVEDANWYGNAERIANNLASAAIAPPDPDPAEPGAIQGNGVRPAVGKDGRGPASGN